MKIRPSSTYYVYNNKEYTLAGKSHGDTPNTFYDFQSANTDDYPDLKLLMRDIKIAFRTINKVQVKGYELFLTQIQKEMATVKVNPGNPAIESLNAKPSDEGGWYEASVLKNDIQDIWEERYPIDGYEFPTNLDFKQKVEF